MKVDEFTHEYQKGKCCSPYFCLISRFTQAACLFILLRWKGLDTKFVVYAAFEGR